MNSLLKQLASYHPSDKQEVIFQQSMLEFLEENKEASFLRTTKNAHFTASAWILNKDKTAVLLIKHAKLNKWLQPGGHADGETDLLMVALKEAREETGLDELALMSNGIFDIDIHSIPKGSSGEAAHEHYDVRYAFIFTAASQVTINHESTAYKWIDLQDIATFTNNTSILRMANKSTNL
jgi:8-oxo-dGTP pyrophosphatase MutT (NUDIX family)